MRKPNAETKLQLILLTYPPTYVAVGLVGKRYERKSLISRARDFLTERLFNMNDIFYYKPSDKQFMLGVEYDLYEIKVMKFVEGKLHSMLLADYNGSISYVFDEIEDFTEAKYVEYKLPFSRILKLGDDLYINETKLKDKDNYEHLIFCANMLGCRII